MLRFLKIAGLLAVGVYLAAMGTLAYRQRELLYFPTPGRADPVAAGFAKGTEQTIATADGERLEAWFSPPQPSHMVVLYFHGNATRLSQLVPRFNELAASGDGVLGVSYRGYGGSTGVPTEQGLLKDADAAYAFLIERGYRPQQIVALGASLGSGVAVALAAKHPVAGLVLDSAFSSTVDVAADMYPYFPVRWLMSDQFHSDERIAKVKAPLLMMHGSADTVVPIAYGRRLFALAHEPKVFLEIPEASHLVLGYPQARQKMQAFLAELREAFAANNIPEAAPENAVLIER